MLSKQSRLLLAGILFMTAVLTSCGPGRNTALSRNYQAFITRYNVYFNGQEHYNTTLSAMERNYEDDYSVLLPVHPADARSNPDAPQPSGDFTRSIEKAQKAIQLRSIRKKPRRKPGHSRDAAYREWMRREEYNPFIHNSWLLLGRSQYNNGDFPGAAATFQYIARYFSWLPETVTEARLWQARCYCAMGWYTDAENILSGISSDTIAGGRLKGIYDMAGASFHTGTSDKAKAIPYIEDLLHHSSAAQKTRLNFLLGQLYADTGDKDKAYKAFGHAAGHNSPHRTRVYARVKQSEVYSGHDVASEIKALQRMARQGRNTPYLGAINYAIGNLYLARQDTASAIDNYLKALGNPSQQPMERAKISQSLGELYYCQRQYIKAQPHYAEAVALLPPYTAGYDTLSLRSDALDKIAVLWQNVEMNDSLLRLVAMPETERLEVINALISRLVAREKEVADSLHRAEYLNSANTGFTSGEQSGNAAVPLAFTLNSDDSWYFYNDEVMALGRQEFQRRWGSRRLEDDWRRRDKTEFGLSSQELSDDDATLVDEGGGYSRSSDTGHGTTAADPHNPEYYLSRLPFSKQARLAANEAIVEGLFNMGLLLKDRLGDYREAHEVWTQLLSRYPDNIYRLDIYYNQYLMYYLHGDRTEAEKYRALILREFPESPEGHALRDEHYVENVRRGDAVQDSLYAATYDAYLHSRNDEVHDACALMNKDYPKGRLMPRFMFLEALTHVTEGDADKFRSTLREIVSRFPEEEVTAVAAAYLKGMAEGRRPVAGDGNALPLRHVAVTEYNSGLVDEDSPVFEVDAATPQLMVFMFPASETTANKLLYDVARHNFSTFLVSDFDLELMNLGRLGLLVVKGFTNFEEIARYRRVLEQDAGFELPPQVRPLMISVSDFRRIVDGEASLDDYLLYIEELSAERPVKTGYIE